MSLCAFHQGDTVSVPQRTSAISGALHPCFLSSVCFERSEITRLSSLSWGWLVGPRLEGKGRRGATSRKAAGQSVACRLGYKELGSQAAQGDARVAVTDSINRELLDKNTKKQIRFCSVYRWPDIEEDPVCNQRLHHGTTGQPLGVFPHLVTGSNCEPCTKTVRQLFFFH